MDLETLTRRLGPDMLARPRVAVDAMGGDHAPEEVVRGAVDWARVHPDVDVTAGHTGAGVASAILHLGRLPGVDRPALAIQMVTDRGPFVLLDIGATTDSTGLNLAQYARMGAIYAEQVLGVRDPSVALLSIGEEGGKGETRVQEATDLLRTSDLRFVGNAAGKDLPK